MRISTRALMAATAASLAFPVHAQSPAEGEGEIIVTARRTSERLIDVPASVTVLTAERRWRAPASTTAD